MKTGKKLFNEWGLSRNFTIIGIAVVLIIVLIVGSLANSGRDLGTGKEYRPANGPATLSNSVELYKLFDDDSQFNFLRGDLAAFGLNTVKNYKSSKVIGVIFTVQGKVVKENDRVSFEGKYKESKDLIMVTVTKLKNDRIHTSITNKKTKASLDQLLPSNTRRNQYIGTLPMNKPEFIISYLSSSDCFFITINGTDAAKTEADAVKELASGLGVKDLSNENVSLVAWGSNGLPVSLPNPDKK